jgi:hypothetical protein
VSEPTPPSIHHRRRWFYVLWVALLLVSGVALWRWRIPARIERPSLVLAVETRSLPGPVDVSVWKGPEAVWPGAAWDGSGAAFEGRPDAAGRLEVPPLEVPFAVRRWVNQDYIRPASQDLVVLRFCAAGQPPRYLHLRLKRDWYQGLLRDGRRLRINMRQSWETLERQAELPPGL